MTATVWKGYISFGLVSFSVRLTSAARAGTVHFHMLHKKDLSRVKEVWFCAEEDKQIDRSDIVKGYETSKGAYVVIEDEELKKIAPATATRWTSCSSWATMRSIRFSSRAHTMSLPKTRPPSPIRCSWRPGLGGLLRCTGVQSLFQHLFAKLGHAVAVPPPGPVAVLPPLKAGGAGVEQACIRHSRNIVSKPVQLR